jgi:phosphonate transport system permease protein
MLRVSLSFAAVAVFCLALADVQVTTLEPWGELGRIARGLLTPDVVVLYSFREAFLNTITFAFCGISVGVIGGCILSVFFSSAPVRLLCAGLRSIHEIFWAFLFLPVVGLTPVCGILAIGIPYAGVFAKVYAEIRQEADQSTLPGLPPGAGRLSRFCYGVLPVIWYDVKSYTSYRLECALRSSAVLGFIGLPTLGFHLETAIREGHYSEAPALLYAFYLLIASLRYWIRPRLVIAYVVASFAYVSTEVHLSRANLTNFLTYEILPWPMRREGYYEGTGEVTFALADVWSWALELAGTEVLEGMWNTLVLTQIALVGTGIFALVAYAAVSRHFAGRLARTLSGYALIVLRTTPEYILAYAMLQLWGPSMLPAIAAITLHNGAILGHLAGGTADGIELRPDAPRRRRDRYFYEVTPRVYGRFLAFLFYRWEIIMRESAILGILGIHTLGFFVDSAINDDHLDKAVFLIVASAILNMGIDMTSQRIRKRLRVSTGSVFTYDL